MKRSCWILSLALISLVMAQTGHACPNCKGAVAANGDSMALGFAWSIALMLAMPAMIVSTWAVVLFRLRARFI